MHIRRHRVDIGCQIAVGDHNALCHRSRTAGKDQHRERVRIDLLVHQTRITEVGKHLALFTQEVETDELPRLLVLRAHFDAVFHVRAVRDRFLDRILLL